jgi:ABC-type bacteriocin/lantibiotic exporter with double-glycine peptidase domain
MLNRLDIFKGTIEDNITMGNKSILLQKIIEVSKAIGLEEYINHTPKGFETIIETTGKKLPRSVIKKIMILRAIINEPSLILLEEPFSELQPESVEKIQHYILHNLPNSTVIVVSNDEPFIKLSDKNFHMHNQQLQINSKK